MAHSFQTGILSIVILLLVVVGIVYCVVRVIKKGCPCQRPQDLPRIPRQSTNPEQGEDLLEITDQTDLENAGSQPPKESSNLIGRDYSREPSGSVAACEDSSQTVSNS